MKVYSTLKSMMVYTDNECPLPIGERTGFGNVVFLLSPTKNSGYDILQGNFLNYKRSMFKNYMIDFVYRDKFGYKKYLKNNTGVFKKEFNDLEFPNQLRLVSNTNKVTILKKHFNIINNLGEWNSLYFQYQIKSSLEKICTNYLSFLGSKINNEDYSDYDKIIYIDVDQWFNGMEKLSFDRKKMTNPISILLVSIYKFPELLKYLGKCDLLFTSSSNSKFMRVSSTELTKETYAKFKARVFSVIGDSRIDTTSVNEELIDNNGTPVVNTTDPVQKINAVSNEKRENARKKIIADLSRNLLGDYEDITDKLRNEYDTLSEYGDIDENPSIDDEENVEPEEVVSDDDNVNEIKEMVNDYLDEHPELLEDVHSDVALKEVEDHVKKRLYINRFTPKYSDKKLKEIQRLDEVQASTIGKLDASFQDLETKIIDESDYSDVVSTTNPNIIKSKFVNFDRSYNKKKFKKDLDNCVGQLSNASTKVFVIGKEEEDTSTQLDLKKTVTYHLQDENGKKMKIKLDIPVIFDDHFVMIKGNKKIIQHQLILKPIVKTATDAVQLVSNYSKMFIYRRGSVDFKTNALLRYLTANAGKFDVLLGNGIATNKDVKTTLEYNIIAKKVTQFQIGNNLIILNNDILKDRLSKLKNKSHTVDLSKEMIIGIDLETMKPIKLLYSESFTDKILSMMPEDMQRSIRKVSTKSNGGKLLMRSTVKIMNKECPTVLLLMYWEGFKSVMEKAKIEYELIHHSDDALKNVDLYEWGITPLRDGYIKWKRYPMENSMLMNGFNSLPTELYSIEDLEDRDTYIYLLTNIYRFANQSFNLDQFKDFMIDPITKEILTDMKYPTNLTELCLLAVSMLRTEDHTIESDLLNMRLRGNEVIAYHTYKAITDAYVPYRKSQHKKNPSPISVKQDEVITRLMKAKAGVTEEHSALNPVLEISRLHSVSYKGESGTNEEHAMTLDVRAYNESMLGTVGITTSPDSGVGIKRQLSMEPNITSTRGYIDVVGKDKVEELNGSNLLTPAELLTPLGVQHDDPTRTAMAYKQSIAMVLVDESDPVLIGNGVEKTLPYHLSSNFTIVAEDDGEVVDVDNDFVVVKYNNGKYRSIDTSLQIGKNSSSGFYIETQMTCKKKVGDKVTKNEVIAWDDKAFAKVGDTKDVSMRLGPLVKIAIIPEWDIYEDSAPVTHAASERMATTMVMPITASFNKYTYISKMAKIGDKITAGQSVISFDNYHDDPEMVAFIDSLREEGGEEAVASWNGHIESHYTGTIVDIKIYTTVELDELSDSLRGIVSEYWDRIRKKENVLNKYSNSDDLNFYKSGNVITEATVPVQPDYQGKVKGEHIENGEGVLIIFYVSFKDYLARGDKLASEFALKSITSHVIDRGLEPYSEFHPDENIDLITAPLSVSARKTPSIFLAMFGNKCLIEAKRHLKDYWENN